MKKLFALFKDGHTNYFTTNHGSMGDIFEAKELCEKYGIRCLAGLEGYIVPNPLEKDKSNYHIIVIPRTNRARRKLNKISSRANVDGYYYKPRIFPGDLLELDKNDVYITTACCAGLLRDEISFEKLFIPLYKHFKESILLEVQTHAVDIQKDINRKCLELRSKYGLRLRFFIGEVRTFLISELTSFFVVLSSIINILP